jgi:hypothetical protein
MVAIIDGDHAATVHTPGYVMLILARSDAAVAFNAAFGVAQELHSSHELYPPSGNADATQGTLGFLHLSDGIVAVGQRRIGRFTQHERISTIRVLATQIFTFQMSTKVEWQEDNAG